MQLPSNILKGSTQTIAKATKAICETKLAGPTVLSFPPDSS